ncbi:MAG: bifunctional biotin--[acetyl-CoA-carboxylase] ligase/biotin operon repressor BirA [Thiohalomonadaceae bacterium]
MASTETLVRLLADGRFHSGEWIGERLGVSRAAVWKSIKALEALGLRVDAVKGRGYRLARPLELLDAERIRAGIAPSVCARIKSLDVHFTIDSTNRYLAGAARNEIGEAHVCLAETQTAGRGRRGRSWCSPFGSNVYLSVAWRFAEGPARLGGLSIALAVASAQALKRLGVPGIQLKWPNDLWLDGRKVAGLLLEVSGELQGPSLVIAGIGVNMGMPEDAEIDQPWADLHSVSPGLSRNEVAGALVEAMIGALERFAGAGFEPFRREWEPLDAVHGKVVLLQLPNASVKGVAAGIDGTGALMLVTGAGLQRFASGEVSLRVGDHVAAS